MLLGHGHSLEDAIVAAANGVFLIVGQMSVLGNNYHFGSDIPGDAVNRRLHGSVVQRSGSLDHHMTGAMTNEHLHSDFGVVLCGVRQVNNRTCNTVSHLIRVGRVDFFKHLFFLLFGY